MNPAHRLEDRPAMGVPILEVVVTEVAAELRRAIDPETRSFDRLALVMKEVLGEDLQSGALRFRWRERDDDVSGG